MAKTSRELYLEIPGLPQAQGSTRIFHDKTGKPFLTSTNPKLGAYRKAIQKAVDDIGGAEPFQCPVYLYCTFILPRPRTVDRLLPWKRPDLDKLLRAVCDALTASGVWGDDSCVCETHAIKRYVREGEEPSVVVWLKELQ